MIDEIIHLLAGYEHIFEECSFSADNTRYATPRFSRRRKKSNRRSPTVFKSRPTPRQELVMPVWFTKRVADNDPIDNVCHRALP
jgi:hypothetical protein